MEYVTYKENGNIDIWKSGKTINLTKSQSVLWTFLYGEVKTYGEIIKYMGKLSMSDYPMTKSLMQQTLMQLKTLDILAYTGDDSESGRFNMISSCEIIPIIDKNIKEHFEKLVYGMIVDNNVNIKKIISLIDESVQENSINIYEAPHAHSVFMAVMNMVKRGNICLA